MIPITLGPIEMNTGTPDSDVSLWYVDGMEGWDSPALRQSTLDPTSRHGTVVTEALLGARSVVLSGVCKAAGEEGLWNSYNRLLGVTAGLAVEFDLVVGENVPKRLGVVRGGNPRIDIQPGHFKFEVPLLAQDPLKYAVDPTTETVPTSGSVALTNVGTFSTLPQITTSGDVEVENFTTALTLRTSLPVSSGTTFDARTRTAFAGTDDQYSKLSPTSVWWSLLPGANEIRNHGSDDVDIIFHSAWI